MIYKNLSLKSNLYSELSNIPRDFFLRESVSRVSTCSFWKLASSLIQFLYFHLPFWNNLSSLYPFWDLPCNIISRISRACGEWRKRQTKRWFKVLILKEPPLMIKQNHLAGLSMQGKVSCWTWGIWACAGRLWIQICCTVQRWSDSASLVQIIVKESTIL